jgi:hypothetical protein
MRASRSGAVLGVVATGAAVVLVLSVQQANRSADAGREDLSNAAEQVEQRLGQEEMQAYADQVYLAEPPPEEYRDHPPPPGSAGWLVVVNASGFQVEDVWVSDGSGGAISIRSAARCTMYALPADFDAEHLYFTGPDGRWHRPSGREEVEVPLDAFPAPETDSGDPAWSGPVERCAG